MLGCTPYPDESLFGFIFRFAERRRSPTPFGLSLAHHVGFYRRLSNRPEAAWLTKLSTITEVPVEELLRLSFGYPDPKWAWHNGIRIPSAMASISVGRERQVCPECLAEAPYHRITWALSFISVCPVHLARLVTRCPDCRRALRWTGQGVIHCSCGCDLSRAPVERLPAADTHGTAVAYGLLGDQRFLAAAEAIRELLPLADLSDGERLDFIWRAGLSGVGRHRAAWSVEKVGEAVFNAHLSLNRGVVIAQDWPDAFIKSVDEMGDRVGRGEARDAILRWLDEGLESGHGAAIREAYERTAKRRARREMK